MGRVVIMGSASAVPDENHENTHLVVIEGDRTILIDCGSNPIQHLRRGGINLDDITDIILTHFHPDHVSGAPLLLMGMWLKGRKRLLNIYGIPPTIDRMVAMMELFDWSHWPGFYPVNFIRVEEKEMSIVLDDPNLRVLSSPVQHLIPTIGLRIEFLATGKVMAYSSDTEPCDAVIRLGRNSDMLLHEASGDSVGHSSAAQAARIGTEAGAKSLYLIHYSPETAGDVLIEQAKKVFLGPVDIARDFQNLQF